MAEGFSNPPILVQNDNTLSFRPKVMLDPASICLPPIQSLVPPGLCRSLDTQDEEECNIWTPPREDYGPEIAENNTNPPSVSSNPKPVSDVTA